MRRERLPRLRAAIARLLLGLVIAHVPLLAVLGRIVGSPDVGETVSLAMLLAVVPLVLLLLHRPIGVVSAAITIALVSQASLLVFLFKGHPWQVEMHFYFFAVLAMLAGFCQPALLLGGAGVIAAQHLLLNGLLPEALFGGGANIGRVLVHAVVVVIETAMLLVIAQVIRRSFEEAERADETARESVDRLEAAGVELSTRLASTHALADHLGRSLGGFRGQVAERLARLAGASQALEQTAETLSLAAMRTTSQTSLASRAAGQATEKVGNVSALGRDFVETISEIGAHATRSATMGAEAVSRAEATTRAIAELESVSGQIGEMTGIIATIAAQTNLLALNATIEAARAGEHGRGFAVVANEVKDLSGQTTRAVAMIGTMVETIRASATRSAAALSTVAGSIGDLNEAAIQIADAVDGRVRAATDIGQSVAQAVDDVNRVHVSISDIEAVADQTAQDASVLRAAAIEIAEQTAAIRREVETFSSDLVDTARSAA